MLPVCAVWMCLVWAVGAVAMPMQLRFHCWARPCTRRSAAQMLQKRVGMLARVRALHTHLVPTVAVLACCPCGW